jgi:RNA polymerase sigma-70 factor (ECF subfamily)
MAIELTARLSAVNPWLEDFHEGQRTTMADVYHEHFATVEAAVGRVLSGADKETVIHEVFFKLIDSADQRRKFQGGSFGAWITTVARNQAIDHARRRDRELPMSAEVLPNDPDAVDGNEAAGARVLIERFRRGLPENWRRVFDLCFLGQVPQREAATTLGLARTTLAYQHHQIRLRLRKFLVPRTSAP